MQESYLKLQQQIDAENYDQALKTALGIQNEDQSEIVCVILAICMMHLSRFQEALKTIPPSNKYEKAYALYRENFLNETIEICQNEKEMKFRHLHAQALYKLGNIDQCLQVYKSIFDKDKLSSAQDLKANLSAAEIQLNNFTKLSFKHSPQDWEVIFNLSLQSFNEDSIELLENSLQNSLKNKIEVDKSLYNAQIAYIQQIQQKKTEQELVESYKGILQQEEIDENIKAVCNNNLVSLRNEGEQLFDTEKKLNQILANQNRLSNLQKKGIYFNKALVCIRKKKIQEANQFIANLRQMLDGNQMEQNLLALEAFLLFREKKFEECYQLLESKQDAFTLQLLAQIYSLQKNYQSASETLQKAMKQNPQLSQDPQFLISLISLQEQTKDLTGIHDSFSLALKYSTTNKAQILEKYADFCFKNEQFNLCVERYKELENEQKLTREQLEKLIISLLQVGLQEAEARSKHLEEINIKVLLQNEEESLEVALERLEYSQIPQIHQETKQQQVKAPNKPKKKKKPRYPKGFDPKNPSNPPPDPERWLPKWQRKQFKKQYKKKMLGKGPQGVVQKEMEDQEKFEFGKGQKSTAHTQVSSEQPAKKHGKKR